MFIETKKLNNFATVIPPEKMKSIFYLHFNQKEIKEKLKVLRGVKAKIYSHYSVEETAKWGKDLPDIFIVSLDRLPSHGRQYVHWLWEAKKRQHIPVIFVDGKPEEIEETKAKFPKAIYCASENLLDKVNSLL